MNRQKLFERANSWTSISHAVANADIESWKDIERWAMEICAFADARADECRRIAKLLPGNDE